MPINEYEFYNGVVLNGLLNSGKSIKIADFPTTSKNSFMLNENKVGIYIKHSRKVISPWRFTFLKEHQEEFKVMTELCENAFLILVCNKDGIVCINNKTLKTLLDDDHQDTEWISASRLARESYEIKGSDGKLKFKINLNDFPKHVIRCL